MKKGKKQFIAGAMAGSLLFSLTFDLQRLDAIQDTAAWHRLAPELRLGYDLGILPPRAFEPRNWTSAISAHEFELAFDRAMQMLGISRGVSDNAPSKPNSRQKSKLIKRGKALERVMQTLVLLETYGQLSLPESEARLVNFSDYSTPPELERAMTYLVNRGIVRGYSDGKIHAARYLSNRDCAYLVSRFYEALSAEKKKLNFEQQLVFVDLPLNHWLGKQLEGLASVGALSLMQFGSSFDGDAWFELGELANMTGGILLYFNRSQALVDLNQICLDNGSHQKFDRRLLAKVLAVTLRHLAHLYPSVNQTEPIIYQDVTQGSELAADLAVISNYGVQLGYVGGKFAAGETITRSEAVSTLYAVIAPLLQTRTELLTPVMANSDSLTDQFAAQSSSSVLRQPGQPVDIDEFVARIQKKQRQIRAILERKKPGSID